MYWAYVFPLAAVAAAAAKYADAEGSDAARVLAWAQTGVAALALGAVWCRMSAHCVRVFRGLDVWDDPLAAKLHGAAQARSSRELPVQTDKV